MSTQRSACRSRWVVILLVFLCGWMTGCATNVGEIVLQAVSATGRTAIDLWLTDFANRLADAFDTANGA